jgi:flagellar biosynthesis protein FlhF
MQIKRFEADDMTEALRMVKREFGDDAVILSAKDVKPSGFFSALRKKHVEITAAADYPAKPAPETNDFNGLLASQLDERSSSDKVSLSTKTPPVSIADRLHQFAAGDAGRANANRYSQQADGKQTLAEPFYTRMDSKKVIALVGPCGAGKSTALAKLAWHCSVVEKRKVGMISLDRYRFSANSLLEKAAAIMGLHLAVVHDAAELQSVFNDMTNLDLIFIDTPGINARDIAMLEAVGALLQAAGPDETHLVVNAAVRQRVLENTILRFGPLAPNRLLFTHLDEGDFQADITALLENFRLPTALWGDGVDLFDGLQIASAKSPTAQKAAEAGHGRITPFPAQSISRSQSNEARLREIETDCYVANRNSELFHCPECKSVKRINIQNIVAFDTIEQAVVAGFKPCRACCDAGEIRKTMAQAM